jgi:hypothetical protein
MQLLAAHQILIGSAIVLAALFGVRGVALFARGASVVNLGLALASFALAAVLVVYFRTLRARWAALRARRTSRG